MPRALPCQLLKSSAAEAMQTARQLWRQTWALIGIHRRKQRRNAGVGWRHLLLVSAIPAHAFLCLPFRPTTPSFVPGEHRYRRTCRARPPNLTANEPTIGNESSCGSIAAVDGLSRVPVRP